MDWYGYLMTLDTIFFFLFFFSLDIDALTYIDVFLSTKF
jgi:hypothetical protein